MPQASAERPAQHPRVEGEIDQLVFDAWDRETRSRRDPTAGERAPTRPTPAVRPQPYLPLVSVDGEGVELWGGAAHGVTPGSLWTVRPLGALPAGRRGDGQGADRAGTDRDLARAGGGASG